jgi:hypothetical protein
MQLRLRLPDVPAGIISRMAGLMAEMAMQHQAGTLSSAPSGKFSNPCEDEGCTYIGQVVEGGTTWLVYLCGEEYVVYKKV